MRRGEHNAGKGERHGHFQAQVENTKPRQSLRSALVMTTAPALEPDGAGPTILKTWNRSYHQYRLQAQSPTR